MTDADFKSFTDQFNRKHTARAIFDTDVLNGVRVSAIPQKHTETWIEEASKITQVDRQSQYGAPLINFLRTAVLWNAFMGTKLAKPITPKDVCWLMSLVKIGREMQVPKRDNGVDAIGYISLVDAIDRDLKSRGFDRGIEIFETMTVGEMADFLAKLEGSLDAAKESDKIE